MGYSYFLQGEFEKAIVKLQKSIVFNGRYFIAYCNMNLVLFCKDQFEEAEKFFEGGMKIVDKEQDKTKTVKEIIENYTNEKTRLEAKINDSEGVNEEKRTLLKTLINGLANTVIGREIRLFFRRISEVKIILITSNSAKNIFPNLSLNS